MDRVEKMLSAWDGNSRKLIDKSYARIVKSMLETLESEAQQEQDAKATDEKDSLNKHIMIVGNCVIISRKHASLSFRNSGQKGAKFRFCN